MTDERGIDIHASDGGDLAHGSPVDARHCPYCAANGGIYDVSARCCQVRLVANMPRKLRLAHYGRLQREFGIEMARDMAEAVKRLHTKREEGAAHD